ncbi:sigma-54-dependent Fis family transcriptional regulator [Desulfuromonas acetoxidans]|uniref:Sigma54 specific transcriptional regulator, Fis family n=1 Tax=Desulfuromonas acetoxidans (strain DSM 684 / 11070) TaxID=281689 RepID=Q1JY50_DESA6|nr:sigma-54-dependent Fis family transcriptional regulator [Desulfuromonas acetoxidans]EAT15146.1 sigma54 specific transcriptional regulator, Fis family [Desulfuromonas acetoxidans DSM 684]MBF0643973.1 sigma-54-dependent Fis family transcriptional regulator [Desulfuromonas acetoxidans]NVD23211.1 sigma-54-dependent Fis family transcriptional regulator [Desulfuromonas acetoxidans]NVE15548.1 sigma-54-dependent Fis family transcriptional regulator [Desulfuromonas acetoxidans]
MAKEVTSIYQSIVEEMTEGVVFLDADDVICICNPAAERIRRVKAERIIGRSIYSLHPGRMHDRIRQLIESLKSGRISSGSRIIHAQKRFFSNSYTAIKAPDGTYLGTLLISRDVTEEKRLREENESLRSRQSDEKMKCLVVHSDAALRVMDMAVSLGQIDSTVLVTGENGTGKECVVELLHQNSPRRNGPLVKVNCAALPDNLIESELFGFVKGAFTGATENRKGKFELANGGTLFLDEVGDLPLASQAKLLRVLQERKVQPLGGKSEVLIDVRIVAATNHILSDDVAGGKFREDLFYRLNVIHIDVPPLRERREDIEPLAEMFLDKFSTQMNKPVRHLSTEALNILLHHHFPGNIRQLEHAMERAVALSSGELILPDDLPQDLLSASVVTTAQHTIQGGLALKEAVDFFERDYIAAALKQCDYKKSKTAEHLGISRKSLWEKIQRYNLTDASVT